MVYDKDFDIEIETRWWNLMTYALKEKLLCLKLEKHLINNRLVLQVQIFPVDRNPKIIYNKFDNDFSTNLLYDTERFIKEYII